MKDHDIIVGIDLGTTNSEVAAFHKGEVRVLGPGDPPILPSVVGLSPSDELLVGDLARNQQLVYPERTVRSVKRKMGTDSKLLMGRQSFTPQEISAYILRQLTEWASRDLGRPVKRAVITVPAYFTDAQRQATRDAGVLAGLDVVRILNEPTAAALAYGFGEGDATKAMVYDLGGGTFDVSIVQVEGDVTEVLSSHGNNHLGGDDFDHKLVELLAATFLEEHDIDLLHGHPLAYSRLWWAAEEAKKRLSVEPFVTVREEALVTVDGKPLHLSREISRAEYEGLIRPMVESTLESVNLALHDAGLSARDLNAVLLVGGATRTPLVWDLLEKRTKLTPRQDVHPDLCVALGAGVLASRLSGHTIERVLVDVCPYSFGVSHLGERGGFPYSYCYRPTIHRNTPLPVTRTELYYTAFANQTAVKVEVFQGEDDDALRNIPVGDFTVTGLTPTADRNEVLITMSLNMDGILNVRATEKNTGLSKQITIQNALKPMSEDEITAARARLASFFDSAEAYDGVDDESVVDAEFSEVVENDNLAAPSTGSRLGDLEDQAHALVERSRSSFDKMHGEDKEEAIDLHVRISEAIAIGDREALEEAVSTLKELLFFVEGR